MDDKTFFSVPSGPLVAFDVDDTLVCWETPKNMEDKEIEIFCNDIISKRVPNEKNVNLLKKFYESGHVVIVWSGSGVRWCNAIVKALGIEKYVHACLSKPSYYVDDVEDVKKWMGKYTFIDINGQRKGHTVHEK